MYINRLKTFKITEECLDVSRDIFLKLVLVHLSLQSTSLNAKAQLF